jgi:hypothetical protein
MLIARLALIVALLSAGTCAASDGYIGWQEIRFKVGNWAVHITQSEGSQSAGLSALNISHNGIPVEIPASTKDQIRDSHLNNVKLLSRCCGDEVVLEIPVFETGHDGHLLRRTWSIVIVGDKFQRAILGPREKGSGDGF